MPWTDPPSELTPDEKLQQSLNEMEPRDAASSIVLMLFGAMLYGPEDKRPEKSHFIDLAHKALSAVKRVSEMDLIKFIRQHAAEAPAEQITKERLLHTLDHMLLLVSKVAEDDLGDVMKLVNLLKD